MLADSHRRRFIPDRIFVPIDGFSLPLLVVTAYLNERIGLSMRRSMMSNPIRTYDYRRIVSR